jgi:hypothetical protein
MGLIIVGYWQIPSLPATIVSPSRICRDHKFRGFASVGLLDSSEAWVTLFPVKRTNADVTISSHLRGGLLCSYSLIRPTPLSTPTRCLSQCSAFTALQLAIPTQPLTLPRQYRRCLNPLLLLLNQLSLPPSRPDRLRLVHTCCATCSPCTSPAVEPQPPSTVASATPVSILDDPDKDVTWQVNLLTRLAPTPRTHAFSPC